MPKGRVAVFALILSTASAAAQDSTDSFDAVGRLIEMPGHNALMETIDASDGPDPFATDGCSGGMSASWTGLAELFPELKERYGTLPPWQSCCVDHDRVYHVAGGARTAEQSYQARQTADLDLRACVIESGEARKDALALKYDVSPDSISRAYVALGEAMYRSVRLGGGPCTGLSWRWGYGYPNCD